MTKLKVYIDFEAISAPFNREIKLKQDFPYAYSIGIFSGKRFKTKTFVFNFSKDDVESIEDILRINILRDLRSLLGKSRFMINKETVKFISYAPALEKKILFKVYKGIKVEDISKGAMISISQATAEYLDKEHYFEYLKEYVGKNVEPRFFEKRGLAHDGAIAAIAGYYLYMTAHNKRGNFLKEDIDIRTVVKELVAYSKDDVERMKFIEANKEDFFAKAKVRKTNILKRNKLSSEARNIDRTVDFLETQKQGLTVEVLIKELKKQHKGINKKIDDIEI